MKRSKFFNIIILGLVLTVAVVGCRKKTASLTNIPNRSGGKIGGPGGIDSSMTRIPGIDDPNSTDSKNTAFRDNGGSVFNDPNHKEDRSMFKPVYFALDSSTIKPDETGKLKTVADYLNSTKSNEVLIEGHCDERGTEGYNVTLGDKRALAVREHLIGLGVSGDRIHTISMGESKPASDGHDESAWKQNRRGEIVVLSPAQ